MGNFVGRINIPTLSSEANDLILSCRTDWVKAMHIICRGRRNKNDGDLSMANDILLPYLIDAGLWDGEEGVPIKKEVCDELWHYIKTITEEPETF